MLEFLSLASSPELEARARRALKEMNYQTPPQKTTVSLRTLPGNEPIIGQVRDALTGRGYEVQIRFVDAPPDGADIKYFHSEDETNAREVERLVEEAISGMGYAFTFESLDGLLRYGRSRKVPFGTIEVRIPLVVPGG